MKLRGGIDRRGAGRSVRNKRRYALALAAAPLWAPPAYAALKTYTGSVSGNWSTLTWTPAGQPVNGDSVLLRPASGDITVTYDAGALSNSLASLTLDVTNAASVTLSQSQGKLTITGSEYVGYTGTGNLNISGGTQTISSSTNSKALYLGYSAGAAGNATLSGNGVLDFGGANNREFVGYAGSGSFTQTGGNNKTSFLTMGDSVGGSGIYTQTGGNLEVGLGEFVGYSGVGTFNQSGGANTTDGVYIGYNSNGTNAGASGVYSMSNGASLLVYNHFEVGFRGNGTFNQTGGNFTASANGMYVGKISGASGTVNLSGGSLVAYGSEYIGYSGKGIFNQTGGTHTVNVNGGTDGLFIGSNPGSSGTYTLSSGMLSIPYGIEYVGSGGNGTFNQSGGSNKALYLQIANGGDGSYTQTDGTLDITWYEYVGGSGKGIFNQSGGSNTAIALYIGYSGPGVYSMSNGASLSMSGLIEVGGSGNGTFNQTGGNSTVAQGGQNSAGMYVGYFSNGTGTVNLSGGSLVNYGIEDVGFTGNGVFNQTGGTHTINGQYLLLGWTATGNGTYTLSNGTLTLTNGYEHVGDSANGVFNQTGGTHTISSASLFLGYYTNGSGAYTLSNGTLAIGGSEYVGYSGAGTFNQSGGNQSIGGALLIASQSGSRGSYNLSGGTVNIGGSISIGGGDGASTGSFTMTGGTLNSGVMSVNPNGSYVQNGGNASVSAFTALAGGTATIGGGSGAAIFTFNGVNADNLTVANNGTAIQKVIGGPIPAARDSSATNTIGALTIGNTSGLLDIGNKDLLLDSGRTSFATFQSYWRAGYNITPDGFGNYDGAHGITSSVAIADNTTTGSGTLKRQVGYINGNVQNIYGFTMADIGGPAIATNRILVRPVLMGDVNFDGVVGPDDIQVILGTNKYNKGPGTATDGWFDGDFNGDGQANTDDIQLLFGANTFNNGSYGAAKGVKATAAKTLTGSAGGSVISLTTVSGGSGDNKLDFVYDPATGDVTVSYDGDPNVTTANSLHHVKLASLNGRFDPTKVTNAGPGKPGAISPGFSAETTTLLDLLSDLSIIIPDHYDLGPILPTGLTLTDLMNDLTLQFGVLNQFSLKPAEVLVPEPTTLGLIGVGAAGLLGRRRKAKNA